MSWEFLTIYWRDMLRFVRFRIALVASLIQPALWMALYGAAMSSNFSRLSAGMTLPQGATAVSYLTFMGAILGERGQISHRCRQKQATVK